MTQVVVTGASGFIGRHLVNSWVGSATEVVAVDRRPTAFPCRFVQADLAHAAVLDPYLTSDTVVFHLAANASVPGSVDDPAADFRDNVGCLFQVLESARRAGCAVVFTSSAAVFDVDNELPLTEASRVRPSSPYGAAKVAGEAYCSAYHRAYGLDVKIARLFNIYGPGMVRFAVYDFVRKLQQNRTELEIIGDGSQVRDYLYVEDAVCALRLIHERGTVGESYQVASGTPVTLLDLAHQVVAAMGHPGTPIVPRGKSWPGDIPRWYADISKLRSLGFCPQVSLEDGLQRTVHCLVDHDDRRLSTPK